MKRTALLIILVLLALPFLVNAQTVCNYLPCGPLPWPLPVLPVLKSPTPIPTIAITAISTTAPTSTSAPTVTGAPTATPEPTGSVLTDFSNLGDQFSTLQAQVNATPVPLVVSGTPVDPSSQLISFASGAGTFFGYLRGFQEVDLGGLTPFISFAIISLVTVIAMKATYYILPIAAAIFGIIMKIVKFIISLL